MAVETRKTSKRITEQRFLDHIADGYQAGQRYCFVLGAGAAKASGIRTGEEMMREWRAYLQKRGIDYIRDCAQDLRLADEDCLPLFDDDYTLKNDDYFTLFDLRFAGEHNVAYAYLEKEMEGKYPSYGYFPLAMLLSNTENRLVITTNFDTLLEDALYTYTFKHPLVVGHESLASYIESDSRHPVIAKIHRDLLFRPFNRKADMEKLKDEWEQPLRNALSRYIPIVIGYAGGDHTFMSLLQKIDLKGIYWCHTGDTPPENIENTVARHDGYLVKILGFDEIMFQLGDRFTKEANFCDPCDYIQEQARKRCALYQESLEKIKEKYEIGKTLPKDSSSRDGEDHGPKGTSGGDGDDEAIAGLIDAIERYDRQEGGEAADSDFSKLLSEAWKKMRSGKNEEALSLYTQLIGLDSDNASHYDRRSTILHRMKRYSDAVEDDTKAIDLDPDNAKYYYSRSVTLHAMREYERALTDQTKAIELDPDNARYYYSRGVTLHEMKKYEHAWTDQTKAIELNPDNAKYYNSRGITLHEMKKYERALTDKTKAIELEPDNAEYYNSRSLTLHEMREYERALTDQTKAIELDPDNAKYYNSRGNTLHEMKKYERALTDKTKAIELDPDNAEYYSSRSVTLHKMREYERAWTDQTKAIELDPDNARYYYSRGVTLHAMRKYERALTDKTKAIELDSDNAKYYNSRGVTLHAMRKYERALTDKTKAIELDPDNAEYYNSRSVTLHEIREYERAWTDKTRAIELGYSK